MPNATASAELRAPRPSSPPAPPQEAPKRLDVRELALAPFRVAVRANAARLYPLAGGVMIVDELEYALAKSGEALRVGPIGQPVATTNALVVDGVTGSAVAPWLAYHYERDGAREEQGTRRMVGSSFAPAGFDATGALVWPAGDELAVGWSEGTLYAIGARGAPTAYEQALARDDPASSGCVRTFSPVRLRADPDGRVVVAGQCSFDPKLASNTQPAVLRLEPVVGAPADAGADASVEVTSYRVHADPLPGAGRDDRVTDLALGDRIYVSVAARGATNAKEARVLAGVGDAWEGVETPLTSPAVGLSWAADGSLWIAGLETVHRRDPEGVWWSIPLPTAKELGLSGRLTLSGIWAASPDDVWLSCGDGQRVLRTGPVAAEVTLALGDAPR